MNEHLLSSYLVISTLSYFFPLLNHLGQCFHIALIESGRWLSLFIPFILTGILDKTPMEEIPGNRRFRKIPTFSSSSLDIDPIELSDDQENIVTDTDPNFNRNAVVP